MTLCAFTIGHSTHAEDAFLGLLQRHGITAVCDVRSQPYSHENGRVLYSRLASTDAFQRGIARVLDGITRYRVALMCAEAEPLDCHRTILISRQLHAQGVSVQHIHGNGELETQEDALSRLMCLLHIPYSDMFRSHAELVANAYARQEQRIGYRPMPQEPHRRSA